MRCTAQWGRSLHHTVLYIDRHLVSSRSVALGRTASVAGGRGGGKRTAQSQSGKKVTLLAVAKAVCLSGRYLLSVQVHKQELFPAEKP